MFDSAAPHYYDYDTIVVEVDDAPTEDLMHVFVLARWHRRTPDLGATACGVLYHSQFSPLRPEKLAGDLCSDCFTPYELGRAECHNERDTSRKGP